MYFISYTITIESVKKDYIKKKTLYALQ